jgi:hypothetical protein
MVGILHGQTRDVNSLLFLKNLPFIAALARRRNPISCCDRNLVSVVGGRCRSAGLRR